MPLLHTVHARFYGALKDFLPPQRQRRRFVYAVKGVPAVKDTIEALGVPHVAVDVIRVNGVCRGFSYQLQEGDELRVYPKGCPSQAAAGIHLARPPRTISFVVDSHLGKLVRHLRLLGFDSLYQRVFPDSEIARIASSEGRIVLTRDLGLLKRRSLRWGYWVRSPDPDRQIREVVRYFGLAGRITPFTLCVECNGRIARVAKARIRDRLPPKTRMFYDEFFRCRRCLRIYWKGSHYARLERFIRRMKRGGRASA